ncbi:MAG: LiaF-related protein [Prevotellaceae bacterium]|jgi:predicted membrane protein|nr:LiaF-related protein [Prevotellaceae bacterium]
MKTFRIFTIRTFILGMIFIASGVLLLLFDSGALPATYKPVIFSWQMLVSIIGATCLFIPHKFWGGLLLIFIGGFFTLLEFNDSLSFLKGNIWAVVAIIAGLFVMFFPLFHVRRFHKLRNHANRMKNLSEEQRSKLFDRYRNIYHHSHPAGCASSARTRFSHHFPNGGGAAWRSNTSGSGYLEYHTVVGRAHEKVNIKDFKGGEINCVFGGVELDFSDAQLAEGVHTLEINSIFGGVVLYFPIDWCVEVRQSQVFGHFGDNRPKLTFEVDEKRMLILEVTSVFGGGEIKLKNND